jgi:hypothetical protein
MARQLEPNQAARILLDVLEQEKGAYASYPLVVPLSAIAGRMDRAKANTV